MTKENEELTGLVRGVKVGTKRGPYVIKNRNKHPRYDEFLTAHIPRALRIAKPNMWVLPEGAFFKGREIRDCFGIHALEEFKLWFEAKKIFDNDRAERLLQQRISGRMSDKHYEQKLTRCYHWIWSVRPEKMLEAHKLVSRMSL